MGVLSSASIQIAMVLGSCDCWEWGYCSGIFVWLKSKQSSYDDSHEARQPIAFVLTITLPLMYFVVTLFFFSSHLWFVCGNVSSLLSVFCQKEEKSHVLAGSPPKTPDAKTTYSFVRSRTRRKSLLLFCLYSLHLYTFMLFLFISLSLEFFTPSTNF